MDSEDRRLFAEGEEEYLQSPSLSTIFSVLAAALTLLLLGQLCRSQCQKSGDSSDDSGEDSEMKSLVIAREVKPGYLIIQGNNNEEIFRIIKEYDTARDRAAGGLDPGPANQSVYYPAQSSNQAAFPADQRQQMNMPLQSYNRGFTEVGPSAPVDMSRPPPYAPFHSH